MRIEVKPDHIARGRRVEPCLCPVALAIAEATDRECSVAPRMVSLYEPYRAYRLPEAVCGFVRMFDAGQPVEPFSFDLDIEEK
jgi:hypothetical protein